MPKGPHGGKRVGAGRRPLLTQLQRLEIADDYRREMQQRAELATAARLKARDADDEEPEKALRRLDAYRTQLANTPNRATRLRQVIELARNLDSATDDTPTRILELAEGLDVRMHVLGERGRYEAGRRPYGVRRAVLEVVAERATKRLGINVSTRAVEECTALLAQIERDVRSASDD